MEALNSFIDIQIVAFCLLFGNYLKNIKSLNNNIIPFLLMFVGAGVSLILRGLAPENLIVGIVSAWVSTGVHSTQSGVRKLYKD